MKKLKTNIFDCLVPEVKNTVEDLKPVFVLRGKKQRARAARLEKLLALENPTQKQSAEAYRLNRRIYRNHDKKLRRIMRNTDNRIPRKYEIYIASSWWQARKNRYFRDFPRICKKCHTKKYIELHHLRYDSDEFGSERNEDLAPLCRWCHIDFHKRFGRKKNYHDDFSAFLRSDVY
jgi:hypothetical protein